MTSSRCDPPADIAAQLRRRHAAARRLAPLDSGVRDPLDELVLPWPRPCSYGLSADELLAEVRRRQAEGWTRDELLARFVDPRTVAA